MNQLNSLIIEGNITRKPEEKVTANGYKVCIIPIAVNRFYKNIKGDGVSEVSYFDIEVFGKMAENCLEKCEIGRGSRVVGRLKQNRWKNNDGKSHSKISIIAEHIEFKKMLTHTENEKDAKETVTEPNTCEEKEMQAANIAACTQEISLEEKVEVPVEAVVF